MLTTNGEDDDMVINTHTRRLPVLASRARAAIERLDVPRPADLPGAVSFSVKSDGCACAVTHTTVIEGNAVTMVRWYVRDRHRHYRWVAEMFEALQLECGVPPRVRRRTVASISDLGLAA
ncbi:hypothetical protein EK0264_08280 [Epidermidibacterium keratini]|uniref:Uncharacterized protein n=1 Tax=Epidermidibacterium keratini TaxID=1891644 RepID=A0A7L4YNZ2_9ACTN|nr:hypothetical protein [Epidermidibacterium keratini]QHC00277.1 hypothetical protein EK0264_08280 [Epidermidibacterium keratini]